VTGNPWQNWKSWRHRMVIEWSRTWSPKLRMTRNQCLGRDHVPSVECDTFDTLASKEIWKRRQKASGPRDVAWQKTIPRVPTCPKGPVPAKRHNMTKLHHFQEQCDRECDQPH
jgi:hypothetical protein